MKRTFISKRFQMAITHLSVQHDPYSLRLPSLVQLVDCSTGDSYKCRSGSIDSELWERLTRLTIGDSITLTDEQELTELRYDFRGKGLNTILNCLFPDSPLTPPRLGHSSVQGSAYFAMPREPDRVISLPKSILHSAFPRQVLLAALLDDLFARRPLARGYVFRRRRYSDEVPSKQGSTAPIVEAYEDPSLLAGNALTTTNWKLKY